MGNNELLISSFTQTLTSYYKHEFVFQKEHFLIMHKNPVYSHNKDNIINIMIE